MTHDYHLMSLDARTNHKPSVAKGVAGHQRKARISGSNADDRKRATVTRQHLVGGVTPFSQENRRTLRRFLDGVRGTAVKDLKSRFCSVPTGNRSRQTSLTRSSSRELWPVRLPDSCATLGYGKLVLDAETASAAGPSVALGTRLDLGGLTRRTILSPSGRRPRRARTGPGLQPHPRETPAHPS